MKRVPMIATKAMRYRTRRLRAGDRVYLTPSEAVVYRAVGLAGDAPAAKAPAPRAAVRPPKVDKPVEPRDPELDQLRAEYESLTGAKPDRRWRAERLRTEITDLMASSPIEADDE